MNRKRALIEYMHAKDNLRKAQKRAELCKTAGHDWTRWDFCSRCGTYR